MLIVGGGYLGRSIFRYFAEAATPPRLLTRNPSLPIELGDKSLIVGDYSEPSVCAAALEGHNSIVWCAGDLLPSSTVADLARIDDVTPLVTMLRAVSHQPETRFVYISSGGTVYGNPTKLPVSESSPLNPVNVYGAAKVLSERWVRRIAEMSTGDARILRCGNVYGPGQRARPTQGVIAKALHLALERKPLPIVGSRTRTRDYIFIDDVLQVVDACLQRPDWSQVMNVGSGHETSLSELLDSLQVVVGPLSTTTEQGSENGVDRIALDIAQLRRHLPGFEPTPLVVGIERAWKALCAHVE
jgi:UDP-glucose 4-epimerase